ncbi:hypothetical protein CVV65_16175 [Kyrpidia spormannii]|uniref:Uncharacterized protein n=1 Tax=Kyrpidia spormannii TaxID=2055160 RepID=A0A2K8NAD4_9BACL|nr:hypothetical protein CVV65_16175 [Kyrpidia spormannii]
MLSITAWVAWAAAVVSLGLAGSMIKRWAKRGGAHHFWWAASFLLYTVAAFGEGYALVWGWTSAIYKIYYYAALVLVATMAAGEVDLLGRGRRGWAQWTFTAYVVVVSLVFLVQLISLGPLDMTRFRGAGTAIGGEAMPGLVRAWYPLLLSMVGGVILIVGPLWSWWETRQPSGLLIAFGAIILSAAGSAAKTGYPALLPISELVGILLIWLGVMRAGSAPRTEQPDGKGE